MRPNIDGNDFFVFDEKFDGQSVAERDGDGVTREKGVASRILNFPEYLLSMA